MHAAIARAVAATQSCRRRPAPSLRPRAARRRPARSRPSRPPKLARLSSRPLLLRDQPPRIGRRGTPGRAFAPRRGAARSRSPRTVISETPELACISSATRTNSRSLISASMRSRRCCLAERQLLAAEHRRRWHRPASVRPRHREVRIDLDPICQIDRDRGRRSRGVHPARRRLRGQPGASSAPVRCASPDPRPFRRAIPAVEANVPRRQSGSSVEAPPRASHWRTAGEVGERVVAPERRLRARGRDRVAPSERQLGEATEAVRLARLDGRTLERQHAAAKGTALDDEAVVSRETTRIGSSVRKRHLAREAATGTLAVTPVCRRLRLR